MAKKKGTKEYYDKGLLKSGYKSTKLDSMDQRKYSQKEMPKSQMNKKPLDE